MVSTPPVYNPKQPNCFLTLNFMWAKARANFRALALRHRHSAGQGFLRLASRTSFMTSNCCVDL